MDILISQITNNFSKILSINEIKQIPDIYWGGNGVGDRFLNKKYNYLVIYKNRRMKQYIFNSNIDDSIHSRLECIKCNLDIYNFFELNDNFNSVKSGIVGIYIYNPNIFSIEQCTNIHRPISKKIIDYYKKISCVVCGSNTDLICDHKNDYYNDIRVLHIKTQRVDDFQSLCNHCNLQKRQICKKEKETQIIYNARIQHPIFRETYKHIKFPWEFKTFDINNIYTKYDTYWYDPIEYQRKIHFYTNYIIPINNEIKQLSSYINDSYFQ